MDKYTLSKYIVAKYSGEITQMKLQKLLYYCYAWQLVAGKKVFDASFEAWPHGPFEPDIYKKYKKFGKNPVTTKETNNKSQPFFDFILDSYAVFSAIELSKTIHHESPWKKYKESKKIIPDQELLSYYSQQPFAKNFPLEKKKSYYPPKTSSHYSFTFDMEKDYLPVFDSLQEYLNGFKRENERLIGIMKGYAIQN